MIKRVAIFILMFIGPLLLMSQINFDLRGTVNERISSKLKEGASVHLKAIGQNPYEKKHAKVLCDGEIEFVNLEKLDRISFNISNAKEFWQVQAILYGAYETYTQRGMLYGLRRELEEESEDYTKYLETNDLILYDSYLENYLYKIAYSILPSDIGDDRTGNIKVKIVKSTIPNAFMLPDGGLFLTTGLLSSINSEEELIGVLAHEIAHFVLDHSVDNIVEAEKRLKKAEFWAGLFTGIAATTDIYLGVKNKYYYPGLLTYSVSTLAYSIAAEVDQRMGFAFSLEQELEADKCASNYLKFINIDPTALSSALIKLKSSHILNDNYYELSEKGTHPSIEYRVKVIGEPNRSFSNADYNIKISLVNSFNAIVHWNSGQLEPCTTLINRNIEAEVATENDYILLAKVISTIHNSEEKYIEALDYIDKAKSLNIFPSVMVHKEEALILMNLERYVGAKFALQEYDRALKAEQNILDGLNNSNRWAYAREFLLHEVEWTAKMIYKMDKLQ